MPPEPICLKNCQRLWPWTQDAEAKKTLLMGTTGGSSGSGNDEMSAPKWRQLFFHHLARSRAALEPDLHNLWSREDALAVTIREESKDLTTFASWSEVELDWARLEKEEDYFFALPPQYRLTHDKRWELTEEGCRAVLPPYYDESISPCMYPFVHLYYQRHADAEEEQTSFRRLPSTRNVGVLSD